MLEEGKSGVVELPTKETDTEDGHDPKLVARLIHSFYHDGYTTYDFDPSTANGPYALLRDPNIVTQAPERLVLHAGVYLLANYVGSSSAAEALENFKKTLNSGNYSIDQLLPPTRELLQDQLAQSNAATDPLRKLVVTYLAENSDINHGCPRIHDLLAADKDLGYEVLMEFLRQKRG